MTMEDNKMRRFFSYLIYLNGLITILLSLVILANIWFPSVFSTNLMSGKIIASYAVVVLNFMIFIAMDKRIDEARQKKDAQN